LFCETRSCNARRHNDLEGHSNFLSTLYNYCSVLGTSLLWRSTVTFNCLKVKSAKCPCLLLVVLVLSFWSWSCYFGLGLGLGLKNLVLFTSLLNDLRISYCTCTVSLVFTRERSQSAQSSQRVASTDSLSSGTSR